jgi:pimeloyl-ACP methyl ester carboxylesterase
MPTVRVNGVNLHYIEAGSGPETIVFAHGLIMDSESYREQLRYFSDRYRVIAYDHRGHGRSEVPSSGYEMDTIADDAAQLIEHLGAPVHFGGLSMGGFVGLRLAARRPELLRSLTLMATSADALEGDSKVRRAITATVVRAFGFGPLARRIVPFMYGATYLGGSANYDWAVRYVRQLPRTLWRPMVAVMERPSVAHELAKITVPTLVIVGDQDTLLPPENSLRLAAGIPGAKLVRLPDTGHLITDENPRAANEAIDAFLKSLAPEPAAAIPEPVS